MVSKIVLSLCFEESSLSIGRVKPFLAPGSSRAFSLIKASTIKTFFPTE